MIKNLWKFQWNTKYKEKPKELNWGEFLSWKWEQTFLSWKPLPTGYHSNSQQTEKFSFGKFCLSVSSNIQQQEHEA